MTDPYAVVAVSPRIVTIEKREDALENTKRLCDTIDQCVRVAATEGAPVKLVVLPEMAIQGMPADFPAGNRQAHEKFAMDVPGPETKLLGEKARQLNSYR
jgi:predicted amidohydrolase